MRRARWLRIVAVLGLVTLVGAACAQDETPGPGVTPGEDGEAFSPGPLGAVEIAPGDPITIATIQAISGETASLGTDQVRGIEIAIADRGAELLGHPIELQVEDDGCAAEQGTTSTQKVVSDPQVVAIIGTSCSGAAVPAAQIMSEAGFTMISASNTSPVLTSIAGEEAEAHQDGYFRTAHNDEIQGRAAAIFAFEELGAQSAATIHDGDPYTEGLATAFGASFQELGGEIVLATAVSKGDTDMRPVLTEVSAAAPDLVFFPIFQPEADFIVQQATEFDELADTEKLMGADGLLSDTFVVLPETEGMYFSGPQTPEGSTYEEFVGKYQEEYGEAPIQAFHAHAYDAANLLFQVIEEVAVEGEDGTLFIDRQALRDAVGATEGFQGLTGSLSCDEFGDCAQPAIDVVQNTEAQEAISDVRGNVLFTYTPEE